MSATTPKVGIVYVVPTDPVADYPAVASAAATTIDKRLGRILAGEVLVSATNAVNTNIVTVTFPAGTFTVPPFVTAQSIGTNTWLAYLPIQVTVNGFQLAATTKSSAAASVTNLHVQWQAISPLAT
jgi:hypothetical protein